MIPQHNDHIVRTRASLLWLATTAVAATVVLLLTPMVGTVLTSATFDGALVALCAAMAVAAATGLWLAVTSAVVDVLRSPHAPGPGRPGVVRRMVLVACGVAVLSVPHAAMATPGDPGPDLAGLPLPDRAVGHGLVHTQPPASDAAPDPSTPAEADPPTPRDAAERVVHVVRAGESLWRIARTRVPAPAANAAVASYVDRLHHSNLDRIGADPDLIHPGQHLQLPEDDAPSPS